MSAPMKLEERQTTMDGERRSIPERSKLPPIAEQIGQGENTYEQQLKEIQQQITEPVKTPSTTKQEEETEEGYTAIGFIHHLEDKYGLAQTTKNWKYGIEPVKCYNGAKVVRLLNSKYAVEAEGLIGWATPEELENILDKVMKEYSKKTGTPITIEKKPDKTYVGVGNDKYYWKITRYLIKSKTPLNYNQLEEIKSLIAQRLHKKPLTNKVPKPDVKVVSSYPEKRKINKGEEVPLNIYVVLSNPPQEKYPIKLEIRYWDKEPTPPLNAREKWKLLKETTIYAKPGQERIDKTIPITFRNPGKYYIIVYACTVDDCWNAGNAGKLTVGEAEEKEQEKETEEKRKEKEEKPKLPPLPERIRVFPLTTERIEHVGKKVKELWKKGKQKQAQIA